MGWTVSPQKDVVQSYAPIPQNVTWFGNRQMWWPRLAWDPTAGVGWVTKPVWPVSLQEEERGKREASMWRLRDTGEGYVRMEQGPEWCGNQPWNTKEMATTRGWEEAREDSTQSPQKEPTPPIPHLDFQPPELHENKSRCFNPPSYVVFCPSNPRKRIRKPTLSGRHIFISSPFPTWLSILPTCWTVVRPYKEDTVNGISYSPALGFKCRKES